MSDDFARTVATYCDPVGAAGFTAKEIKNAQSRDETVWRAVEGFDFTDLRVLDVGCGFGRDVAEFKKRGAEACGVDVSAALLEEARRRYGPEGWLEADVRTLQAPPLGQLWDVVWSINVLVHIPREEMPSLLRRWAGWLRPGGRLIVGTKFGEGEKVYRNLGEAFPRIMVFYTVEELRQVFGEEDMRVEKIMDMKTDTSGDARSGMIWRKI